MEKRLEFSGFGLVFGQAFALTASFVAFGSGGFVGFVSIRVILGECPVQLVTASVLGVGMLAALQV